MGVKTYSQQLVESINGSLTQKVSGLTVVKSARYKDLEKI
jgi:hypothetical protein